MEKKENKVNQKRKNLIFEILIIGFCLFGVVSSILNIVLGIRYGIKNIIIAGIFTLVMAIIILTFYLTNIRKIHKKAKTKNA